MYSVVIFLLAVIVGTILGQLLYWYFLQRKEKKSSYHIISNVNKDGDLVIREVQIDSLHFITVRNILLIPDKMGKDGAENG